MAWSKGVAQNIAVAGCLCEILLWCVALVLICEEPGHALWCHLIIVVLSRCSGGTVLEHCRLTTYIGCYCVVYGAHTGALDPGCGIDRMLLGSTLVLNGMS